MKILFWFIFLPGVVTGQHVIDSLKAAKNNDNPVNWPFYNSNIGYQFLLSQQYDSALLYYYRTIHASHPDHLLNASTMDCMGVAYKQKGLLDSSILYYNKALSLYQLLNDTSHAVVVNANLAIIYKGLGHYDKALESAFDATQFLERQAPARPLASCYNTIGDIYKEMEDFSNALDFYRKSLLIRKEIGFASGVGQSYNNIGELFVELGKYDSAARYLERSLQTKKANNDSNGLGNTLDLLGRVYIELKEFKNAEKYLLDALLIEQRSGELTDEANVLNSLGRLKLKMNNLIEARRYLSQAKDLIVKTASLTLLRDNLEMQVQLSKGQNLFTDALHNAEELLTVKDRLLNQEKAEALIAMQTRYETESKGQQILLLEQEKVLRQSEIKSNKLWIMSLTFTIILALIIAGLLLIGYKQSQRNNRRVETLLKELHHRVKNNLQILSSLLSLQSQYAKDEDAVMMIKSSESRVNSMALIHQKLYKKDGNRTIDLKEYVSELSAYLLQTYGFVEKVEVKLSANAVSVDVEKAIPIGLIMNEWISNALKYAFVGKPFPQLTISLNMRSDRELEIVLSDNGVGLPLPQPGVEIHTFGLKMVNTLIRELKGKLLVNVSEGTSYTLQIPMT